MTAHRRPTAVGERPRAFRRMVVVAAAAVVAVAAAAIMLIRHGAPQQGIAVPAGVQVSGPTHSAGSRTAIPAVEAGRAIPAVPGPRQAALSIRPGGTCQHPQRPPAADPSVRVDLGYGGGRWTARVDNHSGTLITVDDYGVTVGVLDLSGDVVATSIDNASLVERLLAVPDNTSAQVRVLMIVPPCTKGRHLPTRHLSGGPCVPLRRQRAPPNHRRQPGSHQGRRRRGRHPGHVTRRSDAAPVYVKRNAILELLMLNPATVEKFAHGDLTADILVEGRSDLKISTELTYQSHEASAGITVQIGSDIRVEAPAASAMATT